MKKIFIFLSLISAYCVNASIVKQSTGTTEWRPKSAVSLPKASYSFMGSTMADKDKTTLWTVMGSFMVRTQKNKWTKVRPECTDELVRMVDDKRMAAFIGAQGRFVVTRLSDGHYFIRGEVPGKGGGPWLGWLGYAVVKVAVPAIIAKVTGRAIENVSVAITSSERIPERAKDVLDPAIRGLGYMAASEAFPTSFKQYPALERSQGFITAASESPRAPRMSQDVEDAVVAGGAMLLAGEGVMSAGIGTFTEIAARSFQAFLTALPTP